MTTDPAGRRPAAVDAPSGLAGAAAADAGAAAMAAGVAVRELHELDELREACRLFDEIWRRAAGDPALTPELARALAHAGNYVAGAVAGERLVGASVGFHADPVGQALHSHITGVAAGVQGGSVGYALKLHQRAWALARGITRVVWTFDPLVARNAWFNLTKLGAVPTAYLPDFYGPMRDAINAGDASDRLLVEWRLDSERVAAACAGSGRAPDLAALRAAGAAVALDQDERGRPVPGGAAPDAPVALVRVPREVERLRGSDPALARRWRRAVREALGGRMAAGASVTGFARAGVYLLERTGGGP
jgi:predicted GNAT superfamily acetyltransferase